MESTLNQAHEAAITGKEAPLSEAEEEKFKALARLIINDAHFAAILQTARFDRREEIYKQIRPYLMFKANPFHTYKFY